METTNSESKYLLSICIPTYNRASFLKEALSRVVSQLSQIKDNNKIELLVSDNCSTDNTAEVVSEFNKSLDFQITYYRNEENLGFDGNFWNCVKRSRGQFIWLLSDDDYLKENVIAKIIQTIKEYPDAGDIFLAKYGNFTNEIIKYEDKYDFLEDVSHLITFISANIFNSKYTKDIDLEPYRGTSIIQCPLYFTAIEKHPYNVKIDMESLEIGMACQTNGGFNIWKVFMENYFNMIQEFVPTDTKRGRKLFKNIKYTIYRQVLIPLISQCLFYKDTYRYDISAFHEYFFKYYGKCPYAYYYYAKHWCIHKVCVVFPNLKGNVRKLKQKLVRH